MYEPGRTRRREGGRVLFKPTGNKRDCMAEPTPLNSFEWICEDVERLRRDPRAKISERSLRYLKERKRISAGEYQRYLNTPEKPEDRKLLYDRNLMMDINEKLLYMFDSA